MLASSALAAENAGLPVLDARPANRPLTGRSTRRWRLPAFYPCTSESSVSSPLIDVRNPARWKAALPCVCTAQQPTDGSAYALAMDDEATVTFIIANKRRPSDVNSSKSVDLLRHLLPTRPVKEPRPTGRRTKIYQSDELKSVTVERISIVRAAAAVRYCWSDGPGRDGPFVLIAIEFTAWPQANMVANMLLHM